MNCETKITLETRDKVWEETIDHLLQKYNLKDMAYVDETDSFEILSADWESEDGSRTTAKRKKLTKDKRDDILDELKHTLQIQLRIEFSTFEEYFQE